ncbi:unnamed protein product [Rhizophagus irregularis]|nr:unnamed protein product [Rhizophagus irregularis]
MNILIAIFFLIFATFTSSTLIRRQDALNGFKECQGNFPNKITSHEFTPNPIVAGQVVTVHMKGIATVPIEKVQTTQKIVYLNFLFGYSHRTQTGEIYHVLKETSSFLILNYQLN